FKGLRVSNPCFQVGVIVGERIGAKRLAAPEMRQVRPYSSAGDGSANCVAERAWPVQENLFARDSFRRRRDFAWSKLALEPLLVLLRWLGNKHQTHVGMLRAA